MNDYGELIELALRDIVEEFKTHNKQMKSLTEALYELREAYCNNPSINLVKHDSTSRGKPQFKDCGTDRKQ